MNPSFGPAQIRNLLPVFYDKANEVSRYTRNIFPLDWIRLCDTCVFSVKRDLASPNRGQQLQWRRSGRAHFAHSSDFGRRWTRGLRLRFQLFGGRGEERARPRFSGAFHSTEKFASPRLDGQLVPYSKAHRECFT